MGKYPLGLLSQSVLLKRRIEGAVFGHRSRSLLRSLTSGSTDSGYPLSYELSPSPFAKGGS